MKRQIKVTVENISNDHVHFERIVDLDSAISVPYDSIVNSLLWLYQGLNVKVVIQQANSY